MAETYGIELTNGETIFVEHWGMVLAFVNTLRQRIKRVTVYVNDVLQYYINVTSV